MAKAIIKAMADIITKRAINRELFEAIKRKKAHSKRTIANLGKAQVISMAVVEERKKVLDKKRFKKESQYLMAINFYIFNNVIPGSPQKKSPKKPAQKKPVPCAIMALSLNLTSTLATISTMAKELETTALKSPAKALNSFVIVPPTALVTTYSKRIIKRRGG
jgi:hypothetical protein